MKAREFIGGEVNWLSLVVDPCEPANRIPLTVELTVADAKAQGMEFIEAACSAGFDEKRSNFERIVPISFVDAKKRMLYGIVFRANEIVEKSETERYWASPATVRLMMEGFAERGMLGQVDTNHDGKKLKDVFVAEQGIVLAGDPRFDPPTDPHPENVHAYWAGVKVKDTPAGDKVLKLITEGKGRGFSLKGVMVCGPEQEVQFGNVKMAGAGGGENQSGPGGKCICPSCGTTKEHVQGVACTDVKCPSCGTAMQREGYQPKKGNTEMTKDGGKAGIIGQAAAAIGQAVATALSVFSEKIDSQQDTRRLEGLNTLFYESFWAIMQSADIEDKESAVIECIDDYKKAIEDGTKVEMAKIGGRAWDKDESHVDALLCASARGVEIDLAGRVFSKKNLEQMKAAHDVLGKLIAKAGGADGDIEVEQANKGEGDEMDKAQVTDLVSGMLAEALKPLTEGLAALKSAIPAEFKLSEADAGRLAALETKLTAVETKVAAVPASAEQQQAELTRKIGEGETKIAELTTQIEAQKVQLTEQKTLLEKLSGKRPASLSAGGVNDDGDGGDGGKMPELKRREGYPAGILL